jgi:hypothetical protein
LEHALVLIINQRSLKGFKVITRYEVPGKKTRRIIPAHPHQLTTGTRNKCAEKNSVSLSVSCEAKIRNPYGSR